MLNTFLYLGDIRSRLIRLIPEAPPTSPTEAIRRLLSHRFPATCSEKEVRDEWREIVEGRSSLWEGIPPDRKETIRGERSVSAQPSIGSLTHTQDFWYISNPNFYDGHPSRSRSGTGA